MSAGLVKALIVFSGLASTPVGQQPVKEVHSIEVESRLCGMTSRAAAERNGQRIEGKIVISCGE